MACFMVPATGAVVSKLVSDHCEKEGHISFACKVGWLTKLLAGGSVLLAFEHFWHGEIVPFAPFFTAGKAVVLEEMSTVGVAMLFLCLAVWGVMLAVCAAFERQTARENS